MSGYIHIGLLEQEHEKASEDKADLFDFYHKNWANVLQQLKDYQDLRDQRDDEDADARFEDRD